MPTNHLKISFAVAAALAAGAAHSANLTAVPFANPKVTGMVAPTILSPELAQIVLAQGATKLENTSSTFAFYGYNGDGSMVPAPGAVQASGSNVEATKTEPNKNVYLVLPGQHGADARYDYGKRFLYQVHEGGVKNSATGQKMGFLSRINLDADGAHRVTLLASQDVQGNALPTFDGITWNPFAQRLLLTAELGAKGGIWQATPDYPAMVADVSGALGRGGYEGIQNDGDGNVWIVEDVGGASGVVNKRAKQANSFVYRFVPKNKADLTQGGKLQALQVMSLAHSGQPIVFHAGQADADILSQDTKDLHTYGKIFNTLWVTIHDTDVDGSVPFNANALAKAKLATPFKRPENAQFRPGTKFGEFYFDETGDTDLLSEAGSAYGGFGAVQKLTQTSPSANTGKLALFYLGDAAHSGFDNVAFWSKDEIVFVEDAGDKLHSQRNAFDSGYLFNVHLNYADAANQPLRLLAQGRDPSATIDSDLSASSNNGFQNDGDNEITGIHISDGDATARGLLGAKLPHPFHDGWRVFYTQQHGDNVTYEIIRAKKPEVEGARDSDPDPDDQE
jgi:hypothetical protein